MYKLNKFIVDNILDKVCVVVSMGIWEFWIFQIRWSDHENFNIVYTREYR